MSSSRRKPKTPYLPASSRSSHVPSSPSQPRPQFSKSTSAVHIQSFSTRKFSVSMTMRDGRNRDGISYPICVSSSPNSPPPPHRPVHSSPDEHSASDDASHSLDPYSFSDDGELENALFPRYNAADFIDPSTVPDIEAAIERQLFPPHVPDAYIHPSSIPDIDIPPTPLLSTGTFTVMFLFFFFFLFTFSCCFVMPLLPSQM